MAHNFPFSFLCPHGSNNITLSINNHDSDKEDHLIAPGQTPLNPLYSFFYSDREKDGSYSVTVYNYAHGKRHLGTVDFYPDKAPRMAFPWLTWNCKFLVEDGEAVDRWASDVGTLEGHDMEWQWMGWYREGFVVRTFDIEDAYRDVCGVVMHNFDTGRIEVPVHVVRDQNGLDEMVLVAMVAMQLQREISKWNGPQGYNKPPLHGHTKSSGGHAAAASLPSAAAVSRRSSSSSSSSASSGKKKKSGRGKLFGKLGLS